MDPVVTAPPSKPSPAFAWTVEHHRVVTTTQALAGLRPPWTVVTADEQTAGRGQRERTFISDTGGLYLTAVVPYDGRASEWRGFALAVGRHVLDALTGLGVEDLRLRWPNDLMIGPRKVGGILVEQAASDTLLVGLGINITNRPWLEDHTLRYIAGRLLDHSERALTGPAQLLEPVLQAIRRSYEEFPKQRLAGLAPELDRCWGVRRHVWLEAAGEADLPETEGAFAGIDATGQVLLARPDGSVVSVPEHHIQRLVEVE